jgi:prefoldin alpha subunit
MAKEKTNEEVNSLEENQINQELIFKFNLYEQQIQQLQQQLQAVEQAIVEASSLNFGLDDLKESKDKEILASIGKGMFIKSKIISDDLIVDIGGKNFVKKSIPKTQELIKEQIEKLERIKKELENQLEKISEELTQLYMEAQERNK